RDLERQEALWVESEDAGLVERLGDGVQLPLQQEEVGADPGDVEVVLVERVAGRAERNRELLKLVGAGVELGREAGERLDAKEAERLEGGAEIAEVAGGVVGQPGALVGGLAGCRDALLEVLR